MLPDSSQLHSEGRTRQVRRSLSEQEKACPEPGAGSHVLVVEPSPGLGSEFARQLLERGCDVVVAHGPGAEEGLRTLGGSGSLQLLPLDIRDEASFADVAGRLRATHGGRPCLAHIVHCAGLPDHEAWELATADGAAMARVLDASAVAPVLLAKHLLPLTPRPALGGAGRPVLALVGAEAGPSSADPSAGGCALRAAAAALGAVAESLAAELRGRAEVVRLAPGHVRGAAGRWRGALGAPAAVGAMLGAMEAAGARLGGRWGGPGGRGAPRPAQPRLQ